MPGIHQLLESRHDVITNDDAYFHFPGEPGLARLREHRVTACFQVHTTGIRDYANVLFREIAKNLAHEGHEVARVTL